MEPTPHIAEKSLLYFIKCIHTSTAYFTKRKGCAFIVWEQTTL